MVKYHFVQQELKDDPERLLPEDRITVEYGKFEYDPFFGIFAKSEHFRGNKRNMIVGNCEGSLMVIDTGRDVSTNPINKLHIGELEIRRPHAESYENKGAGGVRIDLAWFDTHYAKKMLEELKLWREDSYRQGLLEVYNARRKPDGEFKWYCIPFRIEQLKISPEGLEEKIDELKSRIDWLRQPQQRETRRLVYENCHVIEDKSRQMVILMNSTVKGYTHLKKRKLPKVIVSPDVFGIASEVQSRLVKVLDHICPNINVEEARNYWQEVAAWGKI
ncbi:MAG: hypothetical protein Q8Q31_00315 [Nanoarchaeota archaeon]|nr:hypothetical protein [Nanoarchaeota archaeon]